MNLHDVKACVVSDCGLISHRIALSDTFKRVMSDDHHFYSLFMEIHETNDTKKKIRTAATISITPQVVLKKDPSTTTDAAHSYKMTTYYKILLCVFFFILFTMTETRIERIFATMKKNKILNNGIKILKVASFTMLTFQRQIKKGWSCVFIFFFVYDVTHLAPLAIKQESVLFNIWDIILYLLLLLFNGLVFVSSFVYYIT